MRIYLLEEHSGQISSRSYLKRRSPIGLFSWASFPTRRTRTSTRTTRIRTRRVRRRVASLIKTNTLPLSQISTLHTSKKLPGVTALVSIPSTMRFSVACIRRSRTLCHCRSLNTYPGRVETLASPEPRSIRTRTAPESSITAQKSLVPAASSSSAVDCEVRNDSRMSVSDRASCDATRRCPSPYSDTVRSHNVPHSVGRHSVELSPNSIITILFKTMFSIMLWAATRQREVSNKNENLIENLVWSKKAIFEILNFWPWH